MTESSPLEAAAKAFAFSTLPDAERDAYWVALPEHARVWYRAQMTPVIAAYEAEQTTPDLDELTGIGIEAWASYRYEHRGEVGMDLAAMRAFTAAVVAHLGKGET